MMLATDKAWIFMSETRDGIATDTGIFQNCQQGLKMLENFVKNVLTSGIPVIIMWRKLSYFIPENINESE